MIHPKDHHPATVAPFSFRSVVGLSVVGAPTTSSRNESPRSSSDDDILRDLFRARLDSSSSTSIPATTTERLVNPRRVRTTTNERPRRSLPLMTLSSLGSSSGVGAGLSLFESPTISKEWKTTTTTTTANSLFPLRTDNDDSKNSGSCCENRSSSNNDGPFPWHSALFATSSSSSSTTNDNSRASSSSSSSMTGDAQLDERIRSFSQSLRVMENQQQRQQSRFSLFNNNMNKNNNTRKRQRRFNQATRYRLVGQVLGQKGVQKMISTIKEIKQLKQHQQQQQQHIDTTNNNPAAAAAAKDAAVVRNNLINDVTTVLVDAWENTPTDDLKKLPWEEMLQTSLQHLDTYNKKKTYIMED